MPLRKSRRHKRKGLKIAWIGVWMYKLLPENEDGALTYLFYTEPVGREEIEE